MQTPNRQVRLRSCDGSIYVVENDVLEMCATLRSILRGKTAFKNGLGGLFSVENKFVVLKSEGKILASIVEDTQQEIYLSFPDVKSEVLERVFEYCRYQGLEHTEKEKRQWEYEYVQVKQGLLCEVASAAYYLDIKPLVNLTSRAIASQISTKTSEELRETFSNVNCDLYVPMFATRCRLHRKMAQKKSGKGMLSETTLDTPIYHHPPACTHPPNAPHTVECCTLPLPPSSLSSSSPSSSSSSSSSSYSSSCSSNLAISCASSCCCSSSYPSSSLSSFSSLPSPSTSPTEHDPRSLDELLEFIGGDEKNSKKRETKKKQKKQKRKEDVKREKESPRTKENIEPVTSTSSDGDSDSFEELSPEVQAEIDREVEEFRIRLENSSRNKRQIPKITLPSAISASLSSLQVY